MENIKFIVVDNSPTMRRIILNTLKRAGFKDMLEANDGKEALSAIQSEQVDFLITDWNMPKMDGLTLVKNLREDDKFKQLPIVMVTARSLEEDIIEALKAGVNHYIVKPLSPDILKEKIDQVLNGLK